MKLWNQLDNCVSFFLKILKVRRKGRVCDFDLPRIKAILDGTILFKEALGGLPISLVACEITVVGSGAIGTTLSSFRGNFC